MCWASERQRHLCFSVTLRRIQLGLDEKDTPAKIGSSEISSSEVSPDKIGHSQVSASQVSSNQACPSQAGASQVGAFEFGPNEIGSSVVLLVLDFGSHKFARAQQQGINILPMCCHVQLYESSGTAVSEAFGLFQREAEFTVKRAGWL